MLVNQEINRDPTATNWIKRSFYATSILFNVCLIAQVSRGDNHHETTPDKGFGGTDLLKKSAAY